ncbi:2OG-Fe(II) oxygenase [Fibrella sp. WM1]|uniref:2OG-Fe(II) oxygenase n=1 Tax=Fibrella musci TaxID=3242485 RepID=UPI0035202293
MMPRLFAYHQFKNFLDQTTLIDLLDFTLKNEANYELSKIAKRGHKAIDLAQRKSLTSFELGDFKGLFINQINEHCSELFHCLSMAPFSIKKYEFQLSAHGDGAFFKQHIDTAAHKADGESSRAISMVFYYYSEPKGFEGGELVIHPLPFLPGHDQPVIISPLNNSLVAFPSMAPHEVLPVSTNRSVFDHYRFSVNCWLHK